MSAPASVISLTGHASFRGDPGSMASQQVRAARKRLGLDPGGFAAYLSERVGWDVTPGAVTGWEQDAVPPGDVLITAGGEVAPPGLLAGVPHSFDAGKLSGAWLSCYQFSDPPKFHADIASVTAVSERRVRITNSPPAPRTQGHAFPFRNEIEAELCERHLIGAWRNVSDSSYLGALHLAVLPEENVMEGYYTGVSNYGSIVAALWKWIRVEPASLEGADLDAMTLRDPAELYALAADHSRYDAPLSLSDLGEVA